MKKFLFFMLASLLFVACSGGNHSNSSANTRLQIAAEENYVPYFQRLADEFSQGRNVRIDIVQTPMFNVLDNLATQQGNSADIFMIVNDRIGGLADQRLIAPLNFEVEGYTQNAMDAGMYNNRLYFVPMSTDTTLLIYNRDRVAGAPTFLSQLNPAEWAAKFTDFYHAAGMLSTKGGYIFDASGQLGLNNDGSIEAGSIIQQLYNSGSPHWSLMKDDTVSYDVMMKALADGDVNYIINGPWALADIAAAGVNVGVAPIPSWDGSHPYRALVGTKGMGVNAYSRNAELAQEFLHFLAGQKHAQLWYEMTDEVAPHTGVVYPEGSLQAISYEATNNGQAMPNISAFATVWEPMRTALIQIANGENVTSALNFAQSHIERDIEDLARL